MSYVVGIDLGTTFTAAAVYRPGDALAEVVPLGVRAASIPSVAFLPDDGSMVIGEAAQRRSITDPGRVVREFKRRIGDTTPIQATSGPIAPETLAARFVAAVLARVVEREGAAPDAVMLACPAEWGPHKRAVLSAALDAEGVTDVGFIPEPEVAALGYAYPDRIPVGSVVGVYDLGGGTFDAAVVRAGADGRFEQLGQPVGIDHLGGMDFDEAVLQHVARTSTLAAGLLGTDEEPAEPDTDEARLTAVAVLRRECIEAKEALSSDTEVTIPVLVADGHDTVRMTRAEFEDRIEGAIARTVHTMRQTVQSAGVTPEELAAVVLVGGSSRIPLVAQLLGAELGIPVAMDTDPKAVVSIGAALAGAPTEASGAGLPTLATGAAATVLAGTGAAADAETDDPLSRTEPVPRPPVGPATLVEPRRRPLLTPTAIAAGIVSVAAIVGTAIAIGYTGGGDGSDPPADPTTANAVSSVAPPPPAPGAPADTAPDTREPTLLEAANRPDPTTGAHTADQQTRTPRPASTVPPAVAKTSTPPPTTTTTTPCVVRTESGPKPCGSTGTPTSTETSAPDGEPEAETPAAPAGP